MRRSVFVALPLAAVALCGCDMLTDSDDAPNVDGTYAGEFQVRSFYSTVTPNGSAVVRDITITGAVGFTIQGDRVITTPQAGEGSAVWDSSNGVVYLEFFSIASSNETHCSRWRYHGGLYEADGFLEGDGGIACVQPDDDFIAFDPFPTTYWLVTRQ